MNGLAYRNLLLFIQSKINQPQWDVFIDLCNKVFKTKQLMPDDKSIPKVLLTYGLVEKIGQNYQFTGAAKDLFLLNKFNKAKNKKVLKQTKFEKYTPHADTSGANELNKLNAKAQQKRSLKTKVGQDFYKDMNKEAERLAGLGIEEVSTDPVQLED